jgi:hypothetical protein
MEPSMLRRAAFLFAFLLLPRVVSAAQGAPADDEIATLVVRLEQAGLAGDRAGVLALGVSTESTPGLSELANIIDPTPARFIIKERDRSPLEDGSERLLLEVFVQRGQEARISTWRMDVGRTIDGARGWAIAELERLSVISGLYRLDLNPEKQFEVSNLTVRGPDLAIVMASGSAFVAETPEGPTAIVLLGRGRLSFSPADAAEQTQLRIFAGDTSLSSDFESAFIRIRPGDLDWRFSKGSMVPRAVSQRDLRRAEDVFEEYVGHSLHLDLTDLSRERWSLTPSSGDLIAEIKTRRHGSLTYARSSKDAEDVSLFDRKRRRNISVYASAEKLAARGRSYSEDDMVEYDVLHHDIEASFQPERLWIDGRARMRIRIRSLAVTSLTLRLAEPLTVRSIVSPELGRLLHLRVVGQNSVIVNLPTTVSQNTELWLQVIYSGRLEPQTIEREALTVGPQNQEAAQEAIHIRLEPQWVYSNRSYWHPQNTITDYATARLRISVPADYDVVASGTPAGMPTQAAPAQPGQRVGNVYAFNSERPARYIGCVISRFTTVSSVTLALPSAAAPPAGIGAREVTLLVQANPRQIGRARGLAERSADIIKYYASLLGEAPYPSFTLAIAESDLPGGHSPPYFAVLNQTLPTAPLLWRNDPVNFDNYPPFFLAHELAHQWWGQSVGWKNYHEQWLSEGLAQYFAALYAASERGDDLLSNLLRQMRRWSLEHSDQGPVYLGYRLGHIKGDGRIFRAIIYNKAAVVLHMLRRLMGDTAFFSGVRRFYEQWRFRKAGTEDFRAAMEAAGGGDLAPFFEGWIYGTAIPELRFSYDAGESSAVIRLEHRREVIPLPVTVTISYVGGNREELVIPVRERNIERTIPLTGRVRTIEVNRDNAALAEFVK